MKVKTDKGIEERAVSHVSVATKQGELPKVVPVMRRNEEAFYTLGSSVPIVIKVRD